MSKINFITGIAVLAVSLVFTGTVGCEETSLDILNTESKSISKWWESWGDEPKEAAVQMKEGRAFIEGKSQHKAFGSIHKNLAVDLDKYPVMEIEVESVDYYWYVVISGEQFKFDPANPKSGSGYVLVQEAANKTGKYKYNIKEITGLSGEQKFDLQVGVGKHVGGSNIDCKAIIKSLKFIHVK